MPRARKVCPTRGCSALTVGGPCDRCRSITDRARGTAAERGYTGRGHQRFRLVVLDRDPICVLCQLAPSTVADHHPLSRRDLVTAGLDPDDPTRGRGLCKPCHDSETARNQPGGWNVRA